MSNKKLAILGITAVCMVAAAIGAWRISYMTPAPPTAERTAYLIQGLDPDGIGSIVTGKGKDVITLKRQAKSFVVENKENYPAQVQQINDLITKCLDIQTTQFVTDNPANHKELGVTEEDAQSIVRFFKPDSSLLAGVIIGNTKEEGQGSYVRLIGSDKVYVAADVPWIRSEALDYIDKELVSAARDNIESVTVSSGGAGYTLRPGEAGKGVVLQDIPEGKKLKDTDSDRVFIALTDLRLTDVKKASSELSFDRQYICRLKDSTVYTINIARKDDKTYITCKAEFTDKTPVTVDKQGESEEQLKQKEAKLLARDKAEEFTAKHRGWVYEIAEWKARDLTRELEDLLEDKEQKPESAPGGQGSTGSEQTQP